MALPAYVSERDDLFDGGYSPRRIRFYLGHWIALRSIAIDPAAGRGELDALRREWELVNSDATVMGVCACERRGFYRSTPAEYARGGGYRSEGADNVAVLLADLEHAADALPIHWRATATIFHAQQRAADEVGVQKRRRGFGKGSEMRWSLAIHEAVAVNAAMRRAGTPSPLSGNNGNVFESGEGVSGSAVAPLRVTCPKCGEPLGLDGTCALCDGVI